ncbi:MAG: type II toxin-antitoxin system VapC family toxin [Thaumarchaeota archaeon]|nr:type II toxin-antitoxin system VapC family toxin [Nitrososphaerota archaeon]
MRFLDANIFIYAFYKPRRHLSRLERRMKDSSKRIISDVNDGKEQVLTTVVHLSEVVNILKHSLSINQLGELVTGLLMLDNVDVLEVRGDDYLAAAEFGVELGVDPNDALAVQAMKLRGVAEIYSYDRVFERMDGITRLPSK